MKFKPGWNAPCSKIKYVCRIKLISGARDNFSLVTLTLSQFSPFKVFHTWYYFFQVISNQLDKTVDPCDDFYSYACGGFFKTHVLSVNQSSIGGFTIVNDDNMKVLRQAMETVASNYSQVWQEVYLSKRMPLSRVWLNSLRALAAS